MRPVLCLIMTAVCFHTVAQTAHSTGNWLAGDKVEVQWTPNDNWEKATISEVHSDWNPKRWKAVSETPNSKIAGNMLVAGQIRSVSNAAKKSFSVGQELISTGLMELLIKEAL